MIGQLLSLSRLEVEMGNATFEPGDFELLVGKVVEDARFEARPSGKGILFRSEGRDWILPMREEILRGAVENILRNALRYTPDGTAVDVSVVSDVKGVSLRIRDHGPGAPEGELEKIFCPSTALRQRERVLPGEPASASRSRNGRAAARRRYQRVEREGRRARRRDRPAAAKKAA
jgi:K+-sensing histidine kinase KdpD